MEDIFQPADFPMPGQQKAVGMFPRTPVAFIPFKSLRLLRVIRKISSRLSGKSLGPSHQS